MLDPSQRQFQGERHADRNQRIEPLTDRNYPPQSDEGAILRDFTNAKNDKEERLKELIEQSLQSGTAIYLFNTYDLTSANWQVTLQDLQRQSIKNVYSKRLGSQLSDTIATIVIKEANGAKLSQLLPLPGLSILRHQWKFYNGQPESCRRDLNQKSGTV
jgi:hypothetical protein